MRQSNHDRQAHSLGEDIYYLKDDRTDLCFAAAWIESHSTVVTNVPCNHLHDDQVIHFRSKEK